jgi:hypothetical protein
MTVKVKRLPDRRPELMRQLQTAAGRALNEAAMLVRNAAKQLVSVRYVRVKRQRRRRRGEGTDNAEQA